VDRAIKYDIKGCVLYELKWLLILMASFQTPYWLMGQPWSEAGWIIVAGGLIASIVRPYQAKRKNKQAQLIISSGVLLFKGYKARVTLKTNFFTKRIQVVGCDERNYQEEIVYRYQVSKSDWDYLLALSKK